MCQTTIVALHLFEIVSIMTSIRDCLLYVCLFVAYLPRCSTTVVIYTDIQTASTTAQNYPPTSTQPYDAHEDDVGPSEALTPSSDNPMMQACRNSNRQCVCELTGNWGVSQEYELLETIRKKIDTVMSQMGSLDVHYLSHTVNAIHERTVLLQSKIYSQQVSLSVQGLHDIQKSIDLMTDLVKQLDLESTSSAVIRDLSGELQVLTSVLANLWSNHPSLDVSSLNQQIADLKLRLSGCRENYNISYFRGDQLEISLKYDGLCETHELVGVGDAVTHRYESHTYWLRGNFMKDPFPSTDANRTMVYVRNFIAEGGYTTYYQRFQNYTDFIANRNALEVLNRNTRGDGYTLYKGAIYDHTRDNKINKYIVATGAFSNIDFAPSSIKYLKQDSDTYADFKADETGLYVIYTNPTNGEFLIISKLDPNDLSTLQTWRTSRHKASVCVAFMMCGKLYTIDNCWSRVPPANSNMQYVFDTRTGEESHTKLHVPSKFGQIRQLSYNSRERLLFGWDNGHLVTYPLLLVAKPQTSTPPVYLQ